MLHSLLIGHFLASLDTISVTHEQCINFVYSSVHVGFVEVLSKLMLAMLSHLKLLCSTLIS